MKLALLLLLVPLALSCTSKKTNDSAKRQREKEELRRNAEARDRARWLASMKMAPPVQTPPTAKTTRQPAVMTPPMSTTSPEQHHYKPAAVSTNKEQRVVVAVRFSNTAPRLHLDGLFVTPSAIWIVAGVTSKGVGGRAVTTRQLGVQFKGPSLPIIKAVYGTRRWAGDHSDVRYFTTKAALLKAMGKNSPLPYIRFTPPSAVEEL
mgnify:CR=1 FL=1